MCWKFGFLGVIAVMLCLGVRCLVLTLSSCRHWWGIGPERHTEQPGQDFTSLDDSPMLPCENWNPVLPRDLQGHRPGSQYALSFRARPASGPESKFLYSRRSQGRR